MTPTDQHKETMVARTLEATLGWGKNTFFAGALGGAFYFVITRLAPGTLEYTGACFGGVIGSVLWYGTAHRVRNMMSLWNRFLGVIERVEPDTIRVFSSPDFEEVEGARITGSKIFFVMIALVFFAWWGLISYSLSHITWLRLPR